LNKIESDLIVDLTITKDRSHRILPDSRTPLKAITPMHNVNMIASPGTDAFLKETMPR
jgi:hypothetical protein